jgi:hypothetical protein
MANVKGAERKSWNFGHFSTNHDGRKWRLIRTRTTGGRKFGDDVGKVVASNKSATPLVTLARELTRVEKRDTKLRTLKSDARRIARQISALEAEVAAAVAAAS